MAGHGAGAPLRGVTVIVTRALEQSGDVRESLERLGARVIVSPAIRFEDPGDWSALDEALAKAGRYDWAIFTSVNGVAAVDRRISQLGKSWRILDGVRVVPIGPRTAEALREKGIAPDRMPEIFQAEGILSALEKEPLSGRRILLARAEKAREILPEELRSRGAKVDVVAVYRTLPAEPDPAVVEALGHGAGKRVVVTFTSSSTVEHFLGGLPSPAREALAAATLAAIGPITAGTLRRHGLAPDVMPAEFTVPALVSSLAEHFGRSPAAS